MSGFFAILQDPYPTISDAREFYFCVAANTIRNGSIGLKKMRRAVEQNGINGRIEDVRTACRFFWLVFNFLWSIRFFAIFDDF